MKKGKSVEGIGVGVANAGSAGKDAETGAKTDAKTETKTDTKATMTGSAFESAR
jgi:hypothetical protein